MSDKHIKKINLERLKDFFPDAKGDITDILKDILKGRNGYTQAKIPLDLKITMKKINKILTLDELNSILNLIVKNEEFVDFIQDLFLERL